MFVYAICAITVNHVLIFNDRRKCPLWMLNFKKGRHKAMIPVFRKDKE